MKKSVNKKTRPVSQLHATPTPGQLKARTVSLKAAEKIAKMTPAERQTALADAERILGNFSPPLKAVKSELFGLLLVVAAEFVARYFPDATSASVYVAKYDEGEPQYSTHVALAVPGRKP